MSDSDNIKYELVNHDTVFAGTAVEIVQQMREQAFFERSVDLALYLDHLIGLVNAVCHLNVAPHLALEPKSQAFIEELLRLGYFKEV
ncbi:MAG: hypothetical protein FJY67_11245 [Calditrichaeota bacterium]|nr:hypothetical protein [Calditrichota bacterium]